MALAAQLQQDEYDAEDHARQQDDRINGQRQNAQVPAANANHSVHNERQDTSALSSASANREHSDRSTAGRRPEDLDPKVLSGLGAKAQKKPKEKVSDDKKKKKPDCIIS